MIDSEIPTLQGVLCSRPFERWELDAVSEYPLYYEDVDKPTLVMTWKNHHHALGSYYIDKRALGI